MNNYIWYELLGQPGASCYEIRGRRLTRDGQTETHSVKGLYADYTTLLHAAELLQDYQVSLIHMEDVLTDLLHFPLHQQPDRSGL